MRAREIPMTMRPEIAHITEERVSVTLSVNGKDYPLTLDPRTTLLDALRESLYLTGTKKGCDHGQCGACTVLVNGRRINSCLTLAVMHQGKRIITVEGLAAGGRRPAASGTTPAEGLAAGGRDRDGASDGSAPELHPVQAAFVEHDAFQCGYCTPGQIMSAVGLLNEPHGKSDEEIAEQMSGNICRCGAYSNIRDAVRKVLNENV